MTDQDQGESVATQRAVIKNRAGIHCRPTAVIVKEARTFEDEITVQSEEQTGDAKSAIELLSMGLEEGATVEIHTAGPTASTSIARMVELFETEFDFPPREA